MGIGWGKWCETKSAILLERCIKLDNCIVYFIYDVPASLQLSTFSSSGHLVHLTVEWFCYIVWFANSGIFKENISNMTFLIQGRKYLILTVEEMLLFRLPHQNTIQLYLIHLFWCNCLMKWTLAKFMVKGMFLMEFSKTQYFVALYWEHFWYR